MSLFPLLLWRVLLLFVDFALQVFLFVALQRLCFFAFNLFVLFLTRSLVILIFVPLCNVSFPQLWLLWLSLYYWISVVWLLIIWLGVNSLCLTCFLFIESLEYMGLVFVRSGNSLVLISSDIFSVSSSFQDSSYTIFRLPLIFSQVLDTLFFFFFFSFYFYIFKLGISPPPHCFNLLLGLSTWFSEILHFSY